MTLSRTRGHKRTLRVSNGTIYARWLSCGEFVRPMVLFTHSSHHATTSCVRTHHLRTVLEIEVELDGAVVGAEDFGMDFGGGDPVLEGVGDEEVVEAPSDILLAGVEAVGPPGIFHLVRVLEPP